MKKRNFIILFIILIIFSALSISLSVFIVNQNNETAIKIKDGETNENIKVSSFSINPGETKKDNIYLVSNETNYFDISLKFNLDNDTGLKDYIDLTIVNEGVIILGKTKMSEVFETSIPTFNKKLSNEESYFTIIYSMDESVGNEAYKKSIAFNIDLNVKRSF